MRKRTLGLVSAMLISLVTGPAIAETGTEWMTGYDAFKTLQSMESKGLMPVSITCRDSNKRGLDVGETEYKVKFVKNSNDVHYYWAVGSEYGRMNLQATKEGHRRVSFAQYVRMKSGLTVRCAIWHKP